jgi:hypothetical protein
MKTRLFHIASLATLLISTAWAQFDEPVKVDVPFNFTVGDVHYTAGYYQFKTLGQAGTLKVTSFSGEKSTVLFVARAQDHKAATESRGRVVFHRYGDHYFLANIWAAGKIDGIQVKETREERELAAVTPKTDKILLSAR